MDNIKILEEQVRYHKKQLEKLYDEIEAIQKDGINIKLLYLII